MHAPINHSQKAIIVTGASQGIGAAIAVHLAAEGANLILVARNARKLADVQQRCAANGVTAVTLAGDVARYQTMQQAVSLCLDTFNQVDGLVNNAGLIDPVARLGDSAPDAWGGVIDVNIKGVYHGLRAALPVMKNQGHGTIVNMSSGAAYGAMEGWSHYCASKAAVLSLTACAHKEYGDFGIDIAGLSPGTVATDMQKVIRDSGINPVSQLAWDRHIDPEWVALATSHLLGGLARSYAGRDFSLKTSEGRRLIGLPDVA